MRLAASQTERVPGFGGEVWRGRLDLPQMRVHATILHLMGLNHERPTCRHTGRDYRLTDVSGNVVKDLLA